MFYVNGSDMYLTVFDEKLGVYPAVEIVMQDDGTVTVTRDDDYGVKQKPIGCSVCTLTEIVAQYGESLKLADVETAPTLGGKPSGK